MNGQKNKRQSLPSDKLLAEKAEAEKWVKHFEENGQTDTVWHTVLERINKALGEKPKAEPKPQKGSEIEKEIDYGSQNIN